MKSSEVHPFYLDTDPFHGKTDPAPDGKNGNFYYNCFILITLKIIYYYVYRCCKYKIQRKKNFIASFFFNFQAFVICYFSMTSGWFFMRPDPDECGSATQIKTLRL